MKTNILRCIVGNKSLLEDKAREIKENSLKPAYALDIIRVSEHIKKKYDSANPVQSVPLSAAYEFLDNAIRHCDFEFYNDKEGNLYITLQNFALRYSKWNKPFVRLNLN
jgi:hypothetical protein